MFGFGAFKPTSPLSGGLLWKIPYRLSSPQKQRHRQRLKAVDSVVSIMDRALARQGLAVKSIERWKAEMPTEAEMLPKDKYSVFDRKEKKYRKGVHSKFVVLGGRGRAKADGPALEYRGSEVDEGVAEG